MTTHRDPLEAAPHQWVPMLRPTVQDAVIVDWLHLLGISLDREPVFSTATLRLLWHASQPAVSRRTQALIRSGLASRYRHHQRRGRPAGQRGPLPRLYRIHAHPGPAAFGLQLAR